MCLHYVHWHLFIWLKNFVRYNILLAVCGIRIECKIFEQAEKLR